ncbi:L-lactate permease [Pelistega suis]|uniref:L-lactate permease n=1 Tax=Pelistega suis TaxID=1631957 RepID=UPI00211CA666|nr:L-lactate permease [Pelistega suis]MCQ9329664.1 L-lactate permease [Pelistega suis]
MQWQQLYDPLGNIWLSSLVALIPIVFFFLALTVFRLKGIVAGTITVILAILVALFAYGMPTGMALASAIYGFFYGLWPIAWIIIGAVFLYKISVKTGQFDIIRSSILSLTEDQRMQMLLVGFAFGTFLEGAAGFGAPVAITAALLVGLGFKPLYAAGLCLIANTAPVAFGAMGIPIIVAGQVANIDSMLISQMVGHQLPFVVPIVLVWLMAIMDGWRGVKEMWPAILVGGLSFAITQWATSTYLGPELPDITAAIATLVSLTILCKFWQPKTIFRFDQETSAQTPAKHSYTAGQIAKAWTPFAILTAVVTVWSIKPFKSLFKAGGPLESMVLQFDVPGLHNLVQKLPPVVTEATNYAAIYKFDWFSATGTAILIAAIITIIYLRMKPSQAVATFGETLKELRIPIASIGMVLAFAFVANYSGLSATLALALAHTGKAFTFFSPFLGWLGVFLTGSDTSANALFGALQATTAHQIGVSDVLLVAANTSGGVTGKMISPQSIAIACAAVGLVGKESDLFRFTVKHSLIFAVIIGIIVTVQAYLLPGMIPH